MGRQSRGLDWNPGVPAPGPAPSQLDRTATWGHGALRTCHSRRAVALSPGPGRTEDTVTCAHAFMPNSHRSPERGMTEGTERGSRGQLSSHRGHRTRDAGVRGAGRRGQSREMGWRQSRCPRRRVPGEGRGAREHGPSARRPLARCGPGLAA